MQPNQKNDARCTACLHEFSKLQFGRCPQCNSVLAPMALHEDVTITINWQHIRMLATYSMNWSKQLNAEHPVNRECIKALHAIVELLHKSKPAGAAELYPKLGDVIDEFNQQRPVKPKLEVNIDRQKILKTAEGKLESPFYRKA